MDWYEVLLRLAELQSIDLKKAAALIVLMGIIDSFRRIAVNSPDADARWFAVGVLFLLLVMVGGVIFWMF